MPSTNDEWARSSDGSYLVYTARELERPDNDDRHYRLIRLSNQLEVLLIHDPNTDKASAALDVHVGNLSDPEHLEGLAHFCEHLLFMGTTKYPKENDYFQYCSEHSGHSNAYTDSEHTNFYFEISADYLEGALDRFAQFFICPLFSESCTERELKAVDSEHKKNLQNDGWRLHELEKSLTNPNHPYSKFGTGNLRTLKYNPEEMGLNIRDELLRFHDTYYSANIMKLCVLGKESLDQLTNWVLDKFQDVPNKNISTPVFDGHPLTSNELMKQVFTMPVKDYRCLDLTFPFPYQNPCIRVQPGYYLSHLIGHEGTGSILCYLKRKGWANYLSSGPITGGINFDFFKISIDLTEDGLAHYEDVVATVFQYIRMMKELGVRESIFREVQSLAELGFKFRENHQPSQYTSGLVEQMHQNYPRHWIISGSSLIREYDPVMIQEHLDWLREDGFRLTISTRKQPEGIVLTKKEKWYETEYEEMLILPSVIKAIKNAPIIEELHYPGINEFIPASFETHKLVVEQKQTKPNLIKETQTLRLWHKKDDTFWVPRTNMWILFRNPLADATPAHTVMTSLFADLLVDSLNVYAYNAEVAGLNYYIEEHTGGLLLDFGGYNEKLPLLLQKVVWQMKNFIVNPTRFKLIKEQLERSYKNFALEPPYQHALYYLSYITHEKLWTAEETLLELEAITAEDIQAFLPTLLSHLHMEVLVHGNSFAEEAIGMMALVEDTLRPRPVLPSQLAGPRTLRIPEGGRYVYTRMVPDESNVNSAVEYFIQICDVNDVSMRSRLSLVAQIMQEPCFDQLRTKEQLGYLVFSGVRKQTGCMGLRFIIQSEKDTIYLENRIEVFLDSLKVIIENLVDEDYQAHVNSLIADKVEKAKNLGQEGIQYWSEIQYGYFDFDQVDEDVEELRKTTKTSLLEFFNTYVHPSSAKFRKLSVHIQSQKEPEAVKPKINIDSLHVCLTSQGVTRYNISDLRTTAESCESGASTEEFLRKLLIDETKANENEIETLISKLVGIMKIDTNVDSGPLISVTPSITSDSINGGVLDQNGAYDLASPASRDHTQLPPGNTQIEDLNFFKATMELMAAAVPVRPLPRL